ncbi:MAG: UvrD-helicase domain-containing protein [Nitrosomonadaceae bacterium]|nr:UvrD-helicase domain-containing protein [Nitrosomonadaceae bacterium]
MSATPIPDFAERRRALDPAQSFIVQAPAGSGKTGLLIQRYLRLLACVDAPEEIIAITFTRKAAAEMRERVLAALAQGGKPPATEHEQLTCELAHAALQRDAAAGWQIAANPARLHIQTIDSLCAALTHQMPLLSKFGAQPESVDDASELYLEAARATIELVEGDDAVAQDVERLLEHLDNDVARIEMLLADMLARRDHWLRHIHGRDRDELEAALKNARREALECVCGMYPVPAQDELTEIARYAAANLATAGRSSPLGVCDKLAALPGSADDDVVLWRGIVELLLTKEGDWRRQHDVKNGFPPGSSKAEKEISKSWKERALALIAALKENDTLRQALHDMRRLPPPAYTDMQWEVLGAITRLLPHAVGQLKLVFQVRGQVDFTEVAQAALLALGEPDAPTDLALALDYRIRHLLIDEFQDTSISQYELVAKLIAGWEPGDGRSLFVVGDPMQSIYRFREAEVGLFLRARAEGIGNLALQPVALCANFRSQRGIVDWVNATFAQVMPAQEDIAAGAVPYTSSIATHAILPGTAVNVHAFFNDDHAAEAAKVVEIIKQAQHDEPSATTAILVRNRGHLREIVPRLNATGLRFRAIEIEGLGYRPVVQDLLALTRALAHPADRLAWLAVLRAPWCGLTLADLHALAARQSASAFDDTERTVWELLNDDARMAAVSADGGARLLRVRKVLRDCIGNRCRSSLRTLVEAAWLALGGPACVGDVTDLADAEIYFDYLEAHEEAGSIPELALFEQGLARLFALPDLGADDRLQIMTIHKAKGLEFDHVIVPGLGRLSRSNDKKLFMWMERPRATFATGREDDSTDLLLAPIQETGADGDLIYAWLEKLDADKEYFEDQRLLYVAATRARQRLHLLGSTRLVPDRDGVIEPKLPAGKSLLGKLWQVIEPDYAAAASLAMLAHTPLAPEGEETATEEFSVDQSLRRLASGWTLPAAPPRVAWSPPRSMTQAQDQIEFSWVGETARHAGSVVHRWLQRIAEDQMQGWDAARIMSLRATFKHNLLACGISDSEVDTASERVIMALSHALSDAHGRWLLGPQQDAHNELRLTALIDGMQMNLVIDRTFRDADGQRWVVDYKTSSHEGTDVEGFLDREQQRYRAQLERYAALMRRIDERSVKLGLYFPLLKGWREWEGGG